MTSNVALKCQCGKFHAVAKQANRSGVRMICYCDDCQAGAHYLGAAKLVLDNHGGTDIFPVRPADLEIIQGQEYLKAFRLSPKGMYRWYADCCKTPFANTMASAKIPFAGVLRTMVDQKVRSEPMDELIGPVGGGMMGKFGIGNLPPDTAQTANLKMVLKVIRFITAGFLFGKSKPSPFFDSTGHPLREASVLTKEQRDQLRPLCGPHPTASP